MHRFLLGVLSWALLVTIVGGACGNDDSHGDRDERPGSDPAGDSPAGDFPGMDVDVSPPGEDPGFSDGHHEDFGDSSADPGTTIDNEFPHEDSTIQPPDGDHEVPEDAGLEVEAEDSCRRQCAGRECGDDGCGGTCGTCDDHEECREGLCLVPLVRVDIRIEMPSELVLTVLGLEMGTTVTVSFRVEDGEGRRVVGMEAGPTGILRFALARWIPEFAGLPGQWTSALLSSEGLPGVDSDGVLVDQEDGNYRYTFSTDVSAAMGQRGESFQSDTLHRLVVEVFGEVASGRVPTLNTLFDFVPPGLPATEAAPDVASTAACNECHGRLAAHGGGRFEVGYCVVCHNRGGPPGADMAAMSHAIHAAGMRAGLGVPAFVLGGIDFSGVTYPQSAAHCRKCHDGRNPSTPAGDGWARFPTRAACGACHASTDFVAHQGGQNDDAACADCHDGEDISLRHASTNDTPHATQLLPGAWRIEYQIGEVTVPDGTHPVIPFRVLRDGVPLDLVSPPASVIMGPSFLLAWSGAHGDVTEPADVFNPGRNVGQPQSTSITSLQNPASGTLAALPDGWILASLAGSNAFPAGATRRTVAIQGYLAQRDFPSTGRNLGRPAIAVARGVAGDAKRRTVVDSAKCARCHEWLLGHYGNRVREVATCLLCHNPSLTSSGRSSDPTDLLMYMSTADRAALTAAGYDPDDALAFPEAPMNLKDMVHAIHGAGVREHPYRMVRNRGTSGIIFRDFAGVGFPARTGDCQACHLTGTENAIPADALESTQRITSGQDANRSDVVDARIFVPNLTDLVTSPWSAACAACHDDASAAVHMKEFGGMLAVPRTDYRQALSAGEVENCAACHGPGQVVDAATVHLQ